MATVENDNTFSESVPVVIANDQITRDFKAYLSLLMEDAQTTVSVRRSRADLDGLINMLEAHRLDILGM